MPKKTKVKVNKNKVKKETLLDKIRKFFAKMKVAKPKTTPQIMRMFFKNFNEQNTIMQLDENHYSICFEYQDISFAKANYDEQENIFLKWVEYLHSFNYNDHIQVVCAGRPIKTDDYKKDYIYNEDKFDGNEKKIANEFNTLIETTLGNKEEAEEFAIRREKLNKLIHQTFYRADEGIYSTGSQLDMCYPMLVGVVPDSLYNKVKENVVTMTEEKYKGHIAVGLVGVPILTEWAVRNKQVDFFYQMMKKRDYPGYLYMIDHGATATWEYWSGERSRVHNCYNGIGTWFYQAVGGIRLDEAKPGYRHFYVDPQIPNGVTWAKVTKESPYGTIAVNWKLKDDNQLNLQLTVPAGTTATVCIPNNAVSCKKNKKKVSVKEQTVDVEAGHYDFLFNLK